MSDLCEMAEAYESIRTSAEAGDKAYGYQVLSELAGISTVRAQLMGEGAEFCEEFGEPIPVARRRAAPWAKLCVECQSWEEARHG
jgi:hypothetical protein